MSMITVFTEKILVAKCLYKLTKNEKHVKVEIARSRNVEENDHVSQATPQHILTAI